jgi:hypothetical protein
MRRIAEGVKLVGLRDGAAGARFPLREEPIARYNDPARHIHDATLWVWTRNGPTRPLAALKVEYMKLNIPERRWVLGLVSLAPEKVEATYWDGQVWTSQGPGFEPRAVRKAPMPAGSDAVLMAQARELAQRFAASEYAGPARGRLALRLMPRPIFRYTDQDAGIRAGMVFGFAYGTNPDVLLILEARQHPDPPAWSYGLGRLGGGEATVELDGSTVWTVPYHDPPAQLETYMNRRVAAGSEPN